MKAQLLIACGLWVCRQVLYPGCGRFFSGYVGVFAVLVAASAPAAAEDYDIIIEKNLFHNQRQKWEMEKSQGPGASSQAGPRDQNIDKINLFGTVIKDSHSYAVMRVSESSAKRGASRQSPRRGNRGKDREKARAKVGAQNQNSKRPYAVGDFISGYQIVDIRSKSVLLQDPYDNKQYKIFMNDSQADRTAVRTEIAEDKPAQRSKTAGKERKTPRRSKAKSASSSNKSASSDALRKRFERDLQLMREEKNDAVSRQAERDWQKLEPMIPSLDEKGQEELNRLKSEFEKLRQ